MYHRDYQEREPVEISIEPDKVTILSYAGPDRSISMETIKAAKKLKARRYRNRRLGDFLKELELTEGRATGISTIQDELRKNGSAPARIETDEERSYFLIEIPCRDGFEPQNEPQNEPQISERQKQILKLIKSDNQITRTELAAKTKVSLATTKRDIAKLLELGILKFVGPVKGGHWVIVN